MAKYKIEMMTFDELSKKKSIPRYQRPLVWTKTQKTNFIDNISRGFPFGSLLLYRFDDNDKYSLIDGQQRYTTLEDYRNHPEEYFPVDDAGSNHIAELLAATEIDQTPEATQADLRGKIVKAIKDMFRLNASDSQLSPTHLFDSIADFYPQISQDINAFRTITDIQAKLINDLNEYVDLSSLQIPCVIFTGDKSELPEVFANVNLGGSKLSKYQVFTAQWDSYSVSLSKNPYSDIILEKVIARYDKLTGDRDGIEIENFNSEEMRRNRNITLPEFCHALGELIIEQSNACWPKSAVNKDDTVDTIGYNSLAIVFGIPPQELSGKPANSKGLGAKSGVQDSFRDSGFENDPEAVERLVSRILAEYREINGRFARYLKKPGSAQAYETSRTSVQLQFLSFFAALWRLRYGRVKSTDFEPIPGYKRNGYSQTQEMLFPCFVLDMLNNQWKGSGDSRLANYINGSNDYYSAGAFSESRLQTAIDSYLEDNEHTGNINADPVAKTILTIVSNSQAPLYGGSTYDVEHLVAQKALRSKINGSYAYKTCSIAGGSLGNLAFLTSEENRAKGATSLPDSGGELFVFDGSREFIENPDLLRQANYDLVSRKSPDAAKEFIRNRASLILDQLVSILCS